MTTQGYSARTSLFLTLPPRLRSAGPVLLFSTNNSTTHQLTLNSSTSLQLTSPACGLPRPNSTFQASQAPRRAREQTMMSMSSTPTPTGLQSGSGLRRASYSSTPCTIPSRPASLCSGRLLRRLPSPLLLRCCRAIRAPSLLELPRTARAMSVTSLSSTALPSGQSRATTSPLAVRFLVSLVLPSPHLIRFCRDRVARLLFQHLSLQSICLLLREPSFLRSLQSSQQAYPNHGHLLGRCLGRGHRSHHN